MMPSLLIHSAGLFTTVQDAGRYGYQRYGMPVAGAMDPFSLRLANMLVGNEPGAACLEATIVGPEIEFTDTTTVAVTGADMGLCINGRSAAMNTTLTLRKGDMLSFTGLVSGCRSYISFAGGIDVPEVMGSRSTYLRAAVGGFEGRALRNGDVVQLGKAHGKVKVKELPEGAIPLYESSQTIHIISGPEADRFEIEGLRSFLTAEYTVTDRSDRMGYRLDGEQIVHKPGGADIISAGLSAGTIQVPGDGKPIVLMADRQTTGGYARIANVITADLTLVAQMKPGDAMRFREVTLDHARELLRQRYAAFEV